MRALSPNEISRSHSFPGTHPLLQGRRVNAAPISAINSASPSSSLLLDSAIPTPSLRNTISRTLRGLVNPKPSHTLTAVHHHHVRHASKSFVPRPEKRRRLQECPVPTVVSVSPHAVRAVQSFSCATQSLSASAAVLELLPLTFLLAISRSNAPQSLAALARYYASKCTPSSSVLRTRRLMLR